MTSAAAPSTAPITNSVKSKTPNFNVAQISRSSLDRSPNVSSDEAAGLIDAVPEVAAKNRMARTPPQMTRKMIAVTSEAIDKPKTPAEQLQQKQPRPRRPSQHNNGTGVVEKPPEADPIDLNMDSEQPLGTISDGYGCLKPGFRVIEVPWRRNGF